MKRIQTDELGIVYDKFCEVFLNRDFEQIDRESLKVERRGRNIIKDIRLELNRHFVREFMPEEDVVLADLMR